MPRGVFTPVISIMYVFVSKPLLPYYRLLMFKARGEYTTTYSSTAVMFCLNDITIAVPSTSTIQGVGHE